MIKVSKIWKKIRGAPVLQDVSMEIPEATCCFVLGRSGAGKTVLLKIIAGIIVPDAGNVSYDGRLLRYGLFQDNLEIVRQTSFLFQHGALFDGINVGENIALPLRVRECIAERVVHERVQQMLALVGLPNCAGLRIRDLSGGMIKLVALARALITNPRYLFLDEPTGGLDPVSRERVMSILHSMRTSGKTILAATHDLDLARQIADRIYIIQDSRVHLAVREVKKEDYE